jgi:DNA-binding transcriptional LysR family regulator
MDFFLGFLRVTQTPVGKTSCVCSDCRRCNSSIRLRFADVELWRELGLVYRRDRSLPRAATAFIALLRHRAAADSDAHRPHHH